MSTGAAEMMNPAARPVSCTISRAIILRSMKMKDHQTVQARAEELFRQPWSREVLVDEDGAYLARVPELPGCFADGDSLEEALANLDVVLRDWLSISLERGDPVPAPRRIGTAEPARG